MLFLSLASFFTLACFTNKQQTDQSANFSTITSKLTNQTLRLVLLLTIHLAVSRRVDKKCLVNASLMLLKPSFCSCLGLNSSLLKKKKKREKCNQDPEQAALTFWAFSVPLKEKRTLSKRHLWAPEGRSTEVVC